MVPCCQPPSPPRLANISRRYPGPDHSAAANYPGGAGGKNTANLTPVRLLLGSFLDLLIYQGVYLREVPD